ncbi:BRO-N domain-containing protein [Sessilibacter corallicola]|uniref:BRO-N domain-containing protein n=1 Tax=Sessilibacter corallicola TaxID=2904075 RepID=UPI001E5026B0|nr:Bro-N domain-containing protein [Sessilibacter corallicola]MCE2028731.1 Bro-N domain-containing protein [Sessilibacter corallicola]
MSNNQILLSYPDSGNQIRTITEESVIYFSLIDVVKTLAEQNTQIAQGGKGDGLSGMIKAQIEVLEEDECIDVQGELYVTEPGLFRIILRDNSAACKRFQRWVLHEVLPSIQKYGTYPPPLVEQNSDVKRIVQSLLMEIEEREKLEQRTKEQFKRHENMLNNLSKQIANSSTPQTSQKFISVSEYCESNGIDLFHEQHIFGWCLKIIAEESEPSSKQLVDGKEVLHFPEHVIAKANKNRTA